MSDAPAGAPDGAKPYRTPWRRAPDNPWWIFPFLGRVPDVPPDRIAMLGVVALALLFENYDQAMLTAALKQIAESFSLRESDLGALVGSVHLGAVAAFALVPLADRLGRRRLFLGSLVGLSLATVLTAFAWNPVVFVALQMVSRAFMVTCAATAVVIITEEFPAEHRGWGIGILGALAAAGFGLGLLVFAFIEWIPFGWRGMYAIGAIPLLLLPWLRREVKETGRYRQHASQREQVGVVEGWLRPLHSLLRAYPGRTAAVGAISALASAGMTSAFTLSAYFVQEHHGWAPAQYTLMAVAGGLVGIVGQPWAGRVADTRGRRAVGFALMGAFPFLALAFYHGPGWLLPIVWVPFVFCMSGQNTIGRALGTELFPTSYRGTSAGWTQLCEALGRGLGLLAISVFTPEGASNVPMISIVVFGSLAAALVILLVPESGRRELESISEEKASDA